MKKLLILTLVCFLGLTTHALQSPEKNSVPPVNVPDITGKWISISHNGKNSLNVKKDGIVEFDFGDDGKIELISKYGIVGDTILFNDKEGVTCPNEGKYKFDANQYYLSFNLLQDDCGGRVKSTMGFWVRPDYEETIKELGAQIESRSKPSDYLLRGRMYLALGKPEKARSDFDYYIDHAQPNARIYTNRAGTRFPGDLEGVISDCNKAIEMDPKEKNAYFLRGLALYSLGKKEEACQNFTKAIELGFSILRIAEKQRCAEYWESQNSE